MKLVKVSAIDNKYLAEKMFQILYEINLSLQEFARHLYKSLEIGQKIAEVSHFLSMQIYHDCCHFGNSLVQTKLNQSFVLFSLIIKQNKRKPTRTKCLKKTPIITVEGENKSVV